MPHPQQKHLSGLFVSICSQYFAVLKIRTHYSCTFKKVEDVKRTHTKGGFDWHLPNGRTGKLRFYESFRFRLFAGWCCIFCIFSVLSVDLIALRIFSLQVEYTISSESKEIRTPCQKWFYIKNWPSFVLQFLSTNTPLLPLLAWWPWNSE